MVPSEIGAFEIYFWTLPLIPPGGRSPWLPWPKCFTINGFWPSFQCFFPLRRRVQLSASPGRPKAKIQSVAPEKPVPKNQSNGLFPPKHFLRKVLGVLLHYDWFFDGGLMPRRVWGPVLRVFTPSERFHGRRVGAPLPPCPPAIPPQRWMRQRAEGQGQGQPHGLTLLFDDVEFLLNVPGPGPRLSAPPSRRPAGLWQVGRATGCSPRSPGGAEGRGEAPPALS